jgi:hypothetical protein
MTETINKYVNGKIYKIISYSNPDLVYYGSTIQPLAKRMAQHRLMRGKYKSEQIIELGDAKILLVENYSCNSKEELHRKEGEHILNNNCVNKMVAGRTKKEYIKVHKDDIKEQKKGYYQKNKEIIIERNKKWREQNKERNKDKNKEQRKAYYEAHKEQIKAYTENNKDKIKEQRKARYEAHKKQILEKCKAYYQKNKNKINVI